MTELVEYKTSDDIIKFMRRYYKRFNSETKQESKQEGRSYININK